MSEENLSEDTKSFGGRLLSAFITFIRVLVRLILVTFLLALIALLLFGIPVVYRENVLPIVEDFQSMKNAQTEQAQINERYKQELDRLLQRIDALEIRLDTEKQTFGELDAMLEVVASTQEAQNDSFQAFQADFAESLQKFQGDLDAIDIQIEELVSENDQLSTELNGIKGITDDLDLRLSSEHAPINALRREIQILRVMELLIRSRMLLIQNNLGLAEEDIESARGLLENLEVPEYQQEALDEIVDRLDLAMNSLPESPILAAQDLDIAWNLLKQGLPEEANPSTSTPPPSLSDLTTLTPSPLPSPAP